MELSVTPGEVSAVLGVIGTLILVGWKLHGFQARQDATDRRLESHEMICGERYQRIEQSHQSHVTRSNERHAENVERLDDIRDEMRHLGDKLDRVLEGAS